MPSHSALRVVSLPARLRMKKKISSSLAGSWNVVPSSSSISAWHSVLQISSTGFSRLLFVS